MADTPVMLIDGLGSTNESDKQDEIARQKEEAARKNEEWLRQHLAAGDKFDHNSNKACILFADLVGSTAFKSRHDPIEGMEKVYTHNRCVEEVVESKEFRGEVSKFLGDGVLVFFEGEDAARRGLLAALAVVKEIHRENDKKGWGFPKAMFSRVGLHFGPVWMMVFKSANVRDPQGTTVDIAARLASLAESNQVLVTEETFAAAGGESQFPIHRFTETCTVRGILKPMRLVAVAASKSELKPILLPGGYPPTDPAIMNLLEAASDHWGKSQLFTEDGKKDQQAEEELNASIRAYESILKNDVLNFDANFNLAEHLALHTHNRRAGRAQRLERAHELLRIAASERPSSCYGWKLLSWVRFRQFRESEMSNVDFLNEAIEYAGHALHIADAHKDDYGAAIAKIYLIVYLNMRLIRHSRDSERSHDLDQVQMYVEEVRSRIDAGLGRWLRSQFKTGEALTGKVNGKFGDAQIREMLDEAAKLDNQNRLAIELKLDLLDGVDMSASSRRAR